MVKFLGGLGDNRVKNVETPTFLPEDNIRFGVEYSPDSRPWKKSYNSFQFNYL